MTTTDALEWAGRPGPAVESLFNVWRWVMLFVLGVSLASISILFLGLCYLGVRNPKHPKWASDFLVVSFYIPGAMMLMSFSAGAFYWFLKKASPLSFAQISISLMILIASVAAWRFMDIKKRTKTYEQEEVATVISVDFQQENTIIPPVSGGRAA